MGRTRARVRGEGARRHRSPRRTRHGRGRRGTGWRCAWPITTPATWRTPRASGSRRATLLASIPGVTIVPIADSDICCGSAGIFNLVQPEMAAELGRRKAAKIDDAQARCRRDDQPGVHAADRRRGPSRRPCRRPESSTSSRLLDARFGRKTCLYDHRPDDRSRQTSTTGCLSARSCRGRSRSSRPSSPEGVHNLAPFSFFNVVCGDPPVVLLQPDLAQSAEGHASSTSAPPANSSSTS